MPSITITLTDTPTGGVAVHTDYRPAVGNPCSPAQIAALEIIGRTEKQWGIKASSFVLLTGDANAFLGIYGKRFHTVERGPNISDSGAL